MKIYAIMDGEDWTDASVDNLVIPDHLDINVEKMRYNQWYNEECFKGKAKHMSFVQWLVKEGAREPTKDELEVFWG